MPSTLTGLLLFVVLLLPGFAYVVWKERAGTERRASTFRETVAVVAASITAELVTITVSAPLWTRFVSLGRLLREPGAYWHERPELLVGWGLSLLAVSSGFAVLATLPRLRQRLKYVSGDYPHPSSISSWWMLFERLDPEAVKEVGCVLDDGSFVSGRLRSSNNDADEFADRDLVLGNPIFYGAPGHVEAEPYEASAVCISARRIVTLFVTYLDPEGATSPTSSEPPAAGEP